MGVGVGQGHVPLPLPVCYAYGCLGRVIAVVRWSLRRINPYTAAVILMTGDLAEIALLLVLQCFFYIVDSSYYCYYH